MWLGVVEGGGESKQEKPAAHLSGRLDRMCRMLVLAVPLSCPGCGSWVPVRVLAVLLLVQDVPLLVLAVLLSCPGCAAFLSWLRFMGSRVGIVGSLGHIQGMGFGGERGEGVPATMFCGEA